MEPQDNEDLRFAAQKAIFTVFGKEDEQPADKYCLDKRFVANNMTRFVSFDDLKIQSTKLNPTKTVTEK